MFYSCFINIISACAEQLIVIYFDVQNTSIFEMIFYYLNLEAICYLTDIHTTMVLIVLPCSVYNTYPGIVFQYNTSFIGHQRNNKDKKKS